jgi:hypothetical protein
MLLGIPAWEAALERYCGENALLAPDIGAVVAPAVGTVDQGLRLTPR